MKNRMHCSRQTIIAIAVASFLLTFICRPVCIAAVLINEIHTGVPDWVEIVNTGDAPVDISGWQLLSWTWSVNEFRVEYDPYVFQDGTILQPGEFLVIAEDPVSDCSITAPAPFLWCATESLAVSLETADGASSDLAAVRGFSGDPDLESINGLFIPPFSARMESEVIRRESFVDTDQGADWVCDNEMSPCTANPGQESRENPIPGIDIRNGGITRDSIASPPACPMSPDRDPFTTENIIILVIDGLRYQDAFDPETAGRMPNINGPLRTQGTFLTNFYNMGMTITSPAHAAMLSGTRMPVRNNQPERDNIMMNYPSIFEYYIKHLVEQGVPLEEARMRTCQIYGKRVECATMAASLHPQYGNLYRSNIEFPDPADATHQDIRSFNALMDILDTDHPRLMLINLAQVDEQGHLGTWGSYEYSFRKADEIVDAIWRRIQSDPFYRDKTTLMVLTDHGRNDDAHGAYRHHGCPCKGCRHSFLLVLGPDTPAGVTTGTFHTLVDLSPTVGAILGFDPVYSEGRFITDAFSPSQAPRPHSGDPASLSRTGEASRQPAICADPDRICVGWVEQGVPDRLALVTSLDRGASWSEKRLIDWPHADQTVRWFDIMIDDTGVLWGFVTVSENPDTRETPAEWLICPVNLDSGEEIAPMNSGKMATHSRLLAGRHTILFPWSFYISKGDAPGFAEDEIRLSTINPVDGSIQTMTVCQDQLKSCNPDLCRIGNSDHLVFRHFDDDQWNIAYSRSVDQGATWTQTDMLTPTNGRIVLEPRIVSAGQKTVIVYPQMGDNGTEWNLIAVHSKDTGLKWSKPFALSAPGTAAWEPVIAERNGVIAVVWEYFAGDSAGIAGRVSADGGTTWSEERVLIGGLTGVTRMDAEIDRNDLLLAWSAPFDGQLETYFRRVEDVFDNPDLTDLGVTLFMPDRHLEPGDTCACWLTTQNPFPDPYPYLSLVVLLEAGGQFFFWPSFSAFDYLPVDIEPGLGTFEILQEIEWPDVSVPGYAAWFATLMTAELDEFRGFYSYERFSW